MMLPPPLPPKLLLPLALVAVTGAVLLRIWQRLRACRDQRRIVQDLDKRRCKMLRLDRTRRAAMPPIGPVGAQKPFVGRAYDVEFTDLEGDLGEGVCFVGRDGLRWNEDGIGPGVMLQVAGADLPEYGQNWRG